MKEKKSQKFKKDIHTFPLKKILIVPKTGIEPIFKSYKEFVLPIKLFRL